MIDLKLLSSIEILTLTLIGESRGESIESQVGVACVIRNRVNSRVRSYKDICLQPYQFSCWDEDDPNRVVLLSLAEKILSAENLIDEAHLQCLCVARGIIANEIMDNTRGSLNYLTTILYNSSHKPSWAKKVYFAVEHGNHTFFKINESSVKI